MPDLFVPKSTTTQQAKTNAEPLVQSPQSTPATKKQTPPQGLIPLIDQPMHPLRTLTNYLVHPEGVSFEDQEPNETILLFLRRDKITNIPWILTSMLLILFPILLMIVFQISGNPFGFLSQFQFVVSLLYFLCIITYIFINFINWFYNISLITNERVIDVDFYNIINKSVSATKISLISDVSFSQSGTIQTVFDYGNVLIQTAAAVDKFELERIPRPHEVVQILESLIGEGDNDAA